MRNGSSASAVTIHGEIVLPKFLPRNGPNGGISQYWMSRADQSLTRPSPKMCSPTSPTGIGSPRPVPGALHTAPIGSETRVRHAPHLAAPPVAALPSPDHRRTPTLDPPP